MKKIFSVFLYVLPVMFFVVSYFLLITTGEDIWQGANTAPNIFDDAIAAFHHSARLADMYAWAVINFFDYQFQFGVDIVFRVIDVLMACAIFYLATYIVLQRRPKLQLKDALIFGAIFFLVMATSFGVVLYVGWSKAHNYLLITLVSLLFCICYLRDIWGLKITKSKLFVPVMVILGFLFGVMSNLTALVFGMTAVAYVIYLRIKKRKLPVKKFLCSWRLAGIVGALIGVGIIFLVGNGVGDYEHNKIYLTACDFVSFEQIFSNPFDSIWRIFLHTLYNFGRLLLPFAVVSILLVIYFVYKYRKKQFKYKKMSKTTCDIVFVLGAFATMHLIVVSQIFYIERIVFPAYAAAVLMFIIVVRHLWIGLKKPISPLVPSIILLVGCTVVLILRTWLAVDYFVRITPVLDEIKNTEQDSFCVDSKTAKSPEIPYANFGQEDFLVDWAMPQTIYGKKIYFCDKMK